MWTIARAALKDSWDEVRNQKTPLSNMFFMKYLTNNYSLL